jgi:DNA-binding GntR family transcriptional regulator
MRESKLTRVETLLQCLEEEIIQGELPPGARLDEQLLAERFKVSRTPVREALRHLTSSGLVEIRRHQGAVVRSLTIPELIEMFQVVAELEGLCARLAARRMIKAERKALHVAHRACAGYVEKDDPERFFKANNEFHEIIYAGSHNNFLERETRELRNRVNPHRRYITYQPGRPAASVVEHEGVLAAIDEGDGEEAHRLMREHVNIIGEAAADFIAALPVPAGSDRIEALSVVPETIAGMARERLLRPS